MKHPSLLVLPLAAGLLLPLALTAQPLHTNFHHPAHATPGGLDWHPTITNWSASGSSVTVGWFGIEPPYQVQSAPVLGGAWSNLGDPVNAVNGGSVTAAASGDQNFVRVQGPNPNFVGSSRCSSCHFEVHASWMGTAHQTAFEALKTDNSSTNAACLPCHTVGYGAPTGFKSEGAIPALAGVQCENCHGASGYHRANVGDDVYPVTTPAAEVCGGCHNREIRATFDEWRGSRHSRVNAEVAESFSAAAATNAVPRLLECGPCHSGAVRQALLKGFELPSVSAAADFGITCPVCHDPHGGAHAKQLRNPLFSTNLFSYDTSAGKDFAGQYDPNIQVCAQCHNLRGAQWSDTEAAPHGSPQYNLLIGLGGYANTAGMIGPHGLGANQCAQCHLHQHAVGPEKFSTGHTFAVSLAGCATAGCHSSSNIANNLKAAMQDEITSQLDQLKAMLQTWATTKAPAIIRTQFNALAWEYSTPGKWSNPTGDPQIVGPPSSLQAHVPAAIKQARFNAYLVLQDGSYGVHNAEYARWLLEAAKTSIQTELNQP